MSNATHRRIQRECKEVVTDAELIDNGITISFLSDSSFSHIHAEIRGPPDTPYAGGRFLLDVKFPDNYPFKALQAQFITKVWHPNVSSVTGLICLDILKDKWVATLSLRTVLLSIQQLLACPEPSDPQDAVVAGQYMDDRQLYDKCARFWTIYFASGKGDKDPEMTRMVKELLNSTTNRSEESCVVALSNHKWDIGAATRFLVQ